MREMVNGPETSKQELEGSKENWIENALLNANKLGELKNKALNNDTRKDKLDGLESRFDDQTDWGEAIKKYLFAEVTFESIKFIFFGVVVQCFVFKLS